MGEGCQLSGHVHHREGVLRARSSSLRVDACSRDPSGSAAGSDQCAIPGQPSRIYGERISDDPPRIPLDAHHVGDGAACVRLPLNQGWTRHKLRESAKRLDAVLTIDDYALKWIAS